MVRGLPWLLAAILVAMSIYLWRGSAVGSRAGGDIEPAAAHEPRAAMLRARSPRPQRVSRPGETEPVDPDDAAAGLPPAEGTMSWGAWANQFVRPQPGESFIEYRDRMLPVAQALVAPHRRRVERRYQSAVALAELDDEQIDAVQSVIDGAEDDIKEHIMQGVLSGELYGAASRPMIGVEFAHELLGIVVEARRDVLAQLTEAERDAFRDSGFDIAEYLLFATRWEDLLGVVD